MYYGMVSLSEDPMKTSVKVLNLPSKGGDVNINTFPDLANNPSRKPLKKSFPKVRIKF